MRNRNVGLRKIENHQIESSSTVETKKKKEYTACVDDLRRNKHQDVTKREIGFAEVTRNVSLILYIYIYTHRLSLILPLRHCSGILTKGGKKKENIAKGPGLITRNVWRRDGNSNTAGEAGRICIYMYISLFIRGFFVGGDLAPRPVKATSREFRAASRLYIFQKILGGGRIRR